MLNIDRLRLTNPERIDDSSEILWKALVIAQESADTAEIAFCLHAYGRSLSWSLKLTAAISIFDQTLAYCERIKDDFYLAYTYYRLSFCYSILGNSQVALENTRRGLEIARRIGNDYVIAWNLDSQAFALIKMGRLDDAIQNFKEEIPIRERLGDQQGIVWAIAWQGLVTFYLGNFQKALNLSRTAVETARELNDQASIGLAYAVHGWVLASLGRNPDGKRFSAEALLLLTGSNLTAWAVAQFAWVYTHCQDGDLQSVKENFLSALQRYWELNNHRLVVSMLPVWGCVLAREDKFNEAAELLSLTLHHPSRYRGWLDKDPLVFMLAAMLRADLGEEQFMQAWQRGRQLDFEQVIANVLAGEL
jgi:tetratricopeptide (TPR) repeat protein